jgi:ATP-binding cassette subfamily B protein/subfamily B ATP-binding cassette protein MsbA
MVHRVTYNSTAVETAFQSGFMGTLKSLIMLVSMFVVMLLMNVLLTVVAMTVVPLLVLTIRWYAKRTHNVSLAHQNQEGKVSSLLQEVLSSIRLVKAFNREKLEQKRFDDTIAQSVETRLKSTLVQKSFGFWTALILAAGTAIMFYFGLLEVKSGNLTIGEFIVFTSYLAMLYSPLSVLSYTASSVQSALGGGTRLFEILESPVEVQESGKPVRHDRFEGEIVFRDVDFSYVPDKPVLKNVNLTLRKGETLAVVGETGGGKSTLLNLLLRFYDPQSGSITIDGIDIRDLGTSSLRSIIGFVPQDTILLSDSIRENIAFGRPDATEEEIVQAAKMAHAHNFILECPKGYDSLVGERGVWLSSGQRQRIALARAFLKNAPVLLLDEPTSALDAETESSIEKNLRVNGDRTIVLVAHRLSAVHSADRIIVISRGEIVEEGTHEELLEKEGAYHRLWTTQLSGFEIKSGGVV